ncbi:hypothetical protein KFL_002350110 [Klebsormidium nitens]|uniref:Uncharacterized protein n=1 Tax=Klebsormidium nitens TaxID=105231 RepID=A0A1Y1I9R3_KLENI|nr:hypothetical protein KFL_002350110 [Klebsormidium nitens]|eukprot:GAQ85436.1 hypothetical protein KFL_002350110 [Klebsormidium nitens]
MGVPSTSFGRTPQLLFLVCFWTAGGVLSQQLVSAPPTMTHDFNTYYLSRLGRDIKYYSLLTGRNVFDTNAYNLVNGLPDDISPIAAAALTSPIRGAYVSNGLGGRVAVDVYYKLLRCVSDESNCVSLERVMIGNSRVRDSEPRGVLVTAKEGIGNTGWLINANQSAANALLNLIKRTLLSVVPFTLRLSFPTGVECPFLSFEEALTAAAYWGAAIATSPVLSFSEPIIPKTIVNLTQSNNTRCLPNAFAEYGSFASGQTNDIKDASKAHTTLLDQLLVFNSSAACLATISSFTVTKRDLGEDACSQLYFGDASQRNEAAVTALWLDPTELVTEANLTKLSSICYRDYHLDVETILQQIPFDFDADRLFLVSSTDVKIHLDAVAASAASVVALEIALASSGIVVSHFIARSSFYRRQRVSSGFARVAACTITALAVTTFNVPNFGLVYKSLVNHNAERMFTTVSTRQYQAGNYSGTLLAETHAFVAVRGSAATAIIGLLLYALTLVFSLYVTWEEFSKIISRKNEAARYLGHEALIANEDLLVEWRGTDGNLINMLHPTAVEEAGWAAELELKRRAVARKQLESGGSDTGGSIDRGSEELLSLRAAAYRYQGLDSLKEMYRSGPPPV